MDVFYDTPCISGRHLSIQSRSLDNTGCDWNRLLVGQVGNRTQTVQICFSDIAIDKSHNSESQDSSYVRLKQAYLEAKNALLTNDVDLKRAKVLMIDEQGKVIRLNLFREH